LQEAGAGDVPVVVGGIIPDADAELLREAGVAAVYTPKDWDLNRMMRDIIGLVAAQLDDAGAARSGEAGSRAGGMPAGVDAPAPA
jgi:(2R)-ethylmalonyl-CoA mutase